MNILLDLITLQSGGGVGGAAGFTQAVLQQVVSHNDSGHSLYGVYDSQLSVGGLFDYHQIASQYHIELVDIAQASLREIISTHKIDVFFIAIGQFYSRYDLTGISCKTIMFIHDIFDIENTDTAIDLTLYDASKETLTTQLKRIINLYSGRWQRHAKACYDHIMPLYQAPNTIAYTVSEYTRNAIHYYFPKMAKEISVCHSPIREMVRHEEIEHEALRKLLSSGKPYLLMIAANRKYKNPKTVVKVFKRLADEHPDLHLLTLKYGKSIHPRHIDIPFLSDSDLQNAYRNARALVFASFFEGFGYPPVEAMRYGTPTIASNVTSIPEILGDAATYFSPLYPADLYRAVNYLLQHPEEKKEEMKRRLIALKEREEADMQALLHEIFTAS